MPGISTGTSSIFLMGLFPSLGWLKARALYFRQLESLVRAGIPLLRSLAEMEARSRGEIRRVAGSLSDQVAAGGSLAAGMEKFPRVFPSWQTGLVRAGETGGALPEALGEIATALETDYELGLNLLVAAVYPFFFLLPVILLVAPVAIMFGGPAPPDGWNIPLIIQKWEFYLLTVSLPIALGLAGLVVGWQVMGRSPRYRRWQQSLVIQLPVVGRLTRLVVWSRFTRVLSVLWASGVPVETALQGAAEATGNPVLAARMERAVGMVRDGRRLGDALAATQALPWETLQLVQTGEQTGNIPEMLSSAGNSLNHELAAALQTVPRTVRFLLYLVFVPVVGLILFKLIGAYARTLEEAIHLGD